MDTISKLTFRRFLLGQQGLWPGRRFEGPRGAEAAIRQMGALQLDPLNIIARSQEISLQGRVLNFKPPHLNQAAYEQRGFFDYGGLLFLYPMSELPYFKAIMPRMARYGRVSEAGKNHASAVKDVLAALRAHGPMSNRDFEGTGGSAWSYRGRKDSAVALYYLWLLGKVMITNRRGFDRIYDLTERVAPSEFNYAAPIREAEDFFARKVIARTNIMRAKRFAYTWKYAIEREAAPAEAESKVAEMVEKNIVARLKVEGLKDEMLVLAENLPLLAELESGRVPTTWTPLGPTTQDEVTFLAPLEWASGRAEQNFDFEYKWEVYVPAHKRRWGYYVLPILYGDDLVARLDPKLDRKTNTLHILGFWSEKDAPIKDPSFADALGRGLLRFKEFVGAKKVDVKGIKPVALRKHVQGFLK